MRLTPRSLCPPPLQKGGFTPLASAAWNGNFAIAKLLLDHGAHIDIRNKVTQGAPIDTMMCCGRFTLGTRVQIGDDADGLRTGSRLWLGLEREFGLQVEGEGDGSVKNMRCEGEGCE